MCDETASDLPLTGQMGELEGEDQSLPDKPTRRPGPMSTAQREDNVEQLCVGGASPPASGRGIQLRIGESREGTPRPSQATHESVGHTPRGMAAASLTDQLSHALAKQ